MKLGSVLGLLWLCGVLLYAFPMHPYLRLVGMIVTTITSALGFAKLNIIQTRCRKLEDYIVKNSRDGFKR